MTYDKDAARKLQRMGLPIEAAKAIAGGSGNELFKAPAQALVTHDCNEAAIGFWLIVNDTLNCPVGATTGNAVLFSINIYGSGGQVFIGGDEMYWRAYDGEQGWLEWHKIAS